MNKILSGFPVLLLEVGNSKRGLVVHAGWAKAVAEGTVPVSTPLSLTTKDCLDFGIELGSPVGLEYYDQATFKFNSKIEGAQVKYLGSAAELKQEEREVEGPIPVTD